MCKCCALLHTTSAAAALSFPAGDVTFGPIAGWQHPFRLRQPKKAGAAALAWLAAYMQRVQDELEAPDWLARSPGYTALLDGPSWVDYFLLTELTKNPDGYRSASTGEGGLAE